MDLNKLALEYHSKPTPGKIEVVPTKPCVTQLDLSLAYTPGVAAPCLEIEKKPDDVYKYTSRGNLVAVISNGTAVLGLGNIGALAGKPVMEGKGVLFKRFAGVDVFDIELATEDVDEFINICKKLEPTFGGINLEDIKAPECFEIERRLQEIVDIPVFHDDQHGTAIISGAALLNGCILQGKDIGKIKLVISGAGAAGIACAKFYHSLGVKKDHIVLVDSKGVCYKGREEGMNSYKEEFAVQTKDRTLADALRGADCFSGLSKAGIVTADMVKSMADKPMIFAMANPTPEIAFDEAKAACPNAVIATGRSDFPNQVNNVLGFPFIFRGALDVAARAVNEEMKLAACHALAELARQDVPDSVLRAYGLKRLQFGSDYLIPKPFDPRVLVWEASAVAEAAVKSGVARTKMTDFSAYRERLTASLSRSQDFMRSIRHRVRGSNKRIVFSDGEHPTIIRATQILMEEQIAKPVLIGRSELVRQRAADLGVDLGDTEIHDPHTYPAAQGSRAALLRQEPPRRHQLGRLPVPHAPARLVRGRPARHGQGRRHGLRYRAQPPVRGSGHQPGDPVPRGGFAHLRDVHHSDQERCALLRRLQLTGRTHRRAARGNRTVGRRRGPAFLCDAQGGHVVSRQFREPAQSRKRTRPPGAGYRSRTRPVADRRWRDAGRHGPVR